MKNLLYAVIALTVASIILYVQEAISQHADKTCTAESCAVSVSSNTIPVEVIPTDCGQKVHQHLINFSMATDHTLYRTDSAAQECYIYLEVKADTYVPPIEDLRSPVNLAIVIDRSGSMSGEKLRYAKEAAKFVVNMLEDRDFISIVMYDEEVDVVVKSTQVSNKREILKKIDAIYEDGATNLCGGMMEGYHQIAQNKNERYVNKVLLLSDGLVNEGITDAATIEGIASKEDQENGISISTFGIGLDFNEQLMTALAERGNGNYYFIADAEKIPSIFDRELSGLLKVVAQNAHITLDLPEGIHVSKAFGGHYVLDGNQVKINFRDIYSDETKAILLKFRIEDGYQQVMALQAQLHYDDAVLKTTNQTLFIHSSISPTPNKQAYDASLVACAMQQVALYRMNERIEEAMKATENGEYERSYNLLHSNASDIQYVTDYCGSSIEIARMDSLNSGLMHQTQEYEELSTDEKKILMKSSREANYKMRSKK